jgi:hypothetical protein
VGFKFEIFIEAVLKNERVLRGHSVIGFSWVLLDIEQILNDVNFLRSLTYHEEYWTHEPDLVPKEWISHKVKVVNFISIVQVHHPFFFCLMLIADLYNFSLYNWSLKVYRIAQIHFAKVDKVMFSFEMCYGLAHLFDIKVVLHEKVLVWSLLAPVSCVEFFLYCLACNDSDVIRQYRIEHLTVIKLLFLLSIPLLFDGVDISIIALIFSSLHRPNKTFLSVFSSEFEGYYITHGTDSLVSATSPSVICCRSVCFNKI